MPKLAPTKRDLFNEDYASLGKIKSDGFSILHYNSSPTLALFPGEPFLKQQGTDYIVCIAQSLILPGECKSVLRGPWNAIFPCNLTADVKDGDEVYWDTDDEKVELVANVANGFLLGYATFLKEPGEVITADDDDRPVVGTSSSTELHVVCPTHTTTVEASTIA